MLTAFYLRYIHFYEAYQLSGEQIGKFITPKPRCEYITSLNINCVYWIPPSDLRKYLVKLVSLECLYALDTTLSVGEQDCTLYCSFSKVHYLSYAYTKAQKSES